MQISDFTSLQSLASEVTKTGDAPEASSTAKKAAVGKQDFLKMLLAQLENQDPLNPQNATEFTAQLATFSSLEQLISIQEGIGRIEKLLQSGGGTGAGGGSGGGSGSGGAGSGGASTPGTKDERA